MSTPMFLQSLTVTYAHCIKATPGELDREPFYRYESRTADISIFKQLALCDDTKTEYMVKNKEGLVFSVEDTVSDAVQCAIYKLMVASREAEENKKCPNCSGAGKIVCGELAGMMVTIDCPECTVYEED